MRRTIAAVLALGILAIPAAVPTASAKLAKPTKIDGKNLTVTGGNPWPLGLEGEFGKVRVTFASPSVNEAINKFTVTCTPISTASVSDPITKEFAVAVAGGKYTSATAGFDNTAGQISLTTDPYPGDKYPPLKCKVDATNATGTTAGKVPKLPTSPSADCTNAAKPAPQAPDLSDPKKPIHFLSVAVDAGIAFFPFCTTTTTNEAKFSTDQQTVFTSKVKVAAKTKTVTIKKLLLTAPVNSSIPLSTVGSKIVYRFDKTALSNGTCTASAPKTAGKTKTCVINQSAGTITLTSNDIGVVKVGKPIVGASLDITFTYTGTGTTNITFDSATTNISLGGTPVAVVLKDRADNVPTGCVAGCAWNGLGSDPNRNAPAVIIELA